MNRQVLFAGVIALTMTGAMAQTMPNANTTPTTTSPTGATMPNANRTPEGTNGTAMPNANGTVEPGGTVAPAGSTNPITPPTQCTAGAGMSCSPTPSCPANTPPGTPCPSPTMPAQH